MPSKYSANRLAGLNGVKAKRRNEVHQLAAITVYCGESVCLRCLADRNSEDLGQFSGAYWATAKHDCADFPLSSAAKSYIAEWSPDLFPVDRERVRNMLVSGATR